MKRTYLQPSTEVAIMGAEEMICSSQDITSSNGEITYGGIDENGELDPASRRQYNAWEE